MTRIHAERALLPEGWARDVAVIVEDGRIVAVTPDAVPGQDATGVSSCCRLRPTCTATPSSAPWPA